MAADARTVLTVPEAAVDQRGLRPAVLRLKGGKTEKVEVTLGTFDKATERFEITAGIAVGDTVLVGGALGTAVGTPLVVKPAAAPVAPATPPAPAATAN